MRPLKIAVFSDSALPVLNGVSVSIDVLIGRLRELGHSVFLYTSRYPGHHDRDPNTVRFTSMDTPWTKDYPLAFPPFYPWFGKFKELEFDLVHTHTPFTVGFVGLRWAQSCEIPIVTTYHTHYDKYVHYMPFFPKRFLRYKVAKHTNFYYNSVAHVITPSEASSRWLRRHSVNVPISVIPTGIPDPVPIDRAVARQQLQVPALRKVLLYTGRLAREKNLATLLEAAAIVFDADPAAELWIVGDGPARQELSVASRDMGIGDRVRFWGFVDRAELNRFYSASDVFVFPSQTETQGLVVTEAMSYGLPAVVVKGGGAQDAVENGHNGFIVPNEAGELAERALRLLGDPLLFDKVSSAALESAKLCSVPMMADRVLSVYNHVLDRREAGVVSVG